nr:hypothetical protein [Streptomyces sp. NA02950]
MAWREPRWFFHRGDGAAFLGRAGAAELAAHPDAMEMPRQETSGRDRASDRAEHCPGRGNVASGDRLPMNQL